MRYFPLFFDMTGRSVLLAGGGEQMAQKARLMLRTEARLTVMAPDLVPELADAVARGRMAHVPAVWDAGAVASADLVFAATGCVGIDALIAGQVRGPANVVDRPKLCDVITPSIVDRDPLVIAIGTEGAAPVLGREIRARIEAMLAPDLGGLVALAGRLRPLVADHVAPRGRRAFWEAVFAGAPARLWREGRQQEAEAAIREAALAGAGPATGALSLIGLPVAPDLLPMRAVERLQSADLVLHGPGAAAVLELARRDAERAPLPEDPAALLARLDAALSEGARAVVLAARAPALAGALARLAPERILPAPEPGRDQEEAG